MRGATAGAQLEDPWSRSDRSMVVRILSARWVLPRAAAWIDHGGVIVERGRVTALVSGASAIRRAERKLGARATDLGDVVLAPGFVDAHAHLELSALAGRVSARGSFTAWVERLIAERARLSTRDLDASLHRAADRLVATGTTFVGDIDSTGAVDRVLRRHSLRVRAYREALDAGDPARTKTAFARAARRALARTRMLAGLSPHAPYTVSPALFAMLAKLHARRRWPVAIHWAETREESDWLDRGRGPMSRLLRDSPRTTGLDLIERAGLLRARTTLIHGNHPAPGDLDRIRASGAAVVHCPGTHAFFGREPFDLAAYLERGISVGLGTDSLASNGDLDMRREMQLARRAFPWLAPEIVWDMATRQSAAAAGIGSRAGEIMPGAWADLVAHRVSRPRARPALLEVLTSGESLVEGVWIAGRALRVPSVAPPPWPGLEKTVRISET